MQTWLAAFLVIAAIAVALQAILLFAIYLVIRETSDRISKVLDSQILPLTQRLRMFIEESHEDLHDIVHETAELARLMRANGRRFDRLLEEGAERLRLQIIHADRLVTGALEVIEDAANELRKSCVEPLRTATAFVRGVRAGVDFFRGRQRIPERRREAEDEGLFV